MEWVRSRVAKHGGNEKGGEGEYFASDNVAVEKPLVNRVNPRLQLAQSVALSFGRLCPDTTSKKRDFQIRGGSGTDFFRNSLREHCAMDARVVITIVLRVRALRTECGVGPAQRRRADCSCLRGKRKPSF